MIYKQAQQLIFSLTGHVSQLLFIHVREDGTINAQITTGNPLAPIVAVHSNNVCESDVMEALETELETVPLLPHVLSEIDMWGYSLVPTAPFVTIH